MSKRGKSILLDMLEHDYLTDKYEVRRFESKYFNRIDFNAEIKAILEVKKKNRVAIFDQFEQVLKPNSPNQHEILSAINDMAKCTDPQKLDQKSNE